MIELLKEFLLFGYIEIIILLMFYRIVGNIKEVKYWHSLIISPFVMICGLLTIPYARQIGVIFVMMIYLIYITKFFNRNLKLVTISILYLLVIEIMFSIFYELIFNIDLSIEISMIEKLSYMIPIRIFEISIIILLNKTRRN